MATIIKYIRFPVTFSAEKLAAEVEALSAKWIAHFNKAHYEGEWSALPLRSIGGSLENLLPQKFTDGEFLDTVLMDQCPYAKNVLEYFPCEIQTVRLLKLMPGAVIKEHTDNDLCYEEGEARIHVPVLTNPGVEFYLDNEQLVMNAGECWYTNVNLPHRLANNGDTPRIHLVIDIVINDKVREMFENAPAGNKKIIAAKEKYSAGDKVNIIAALRGLNTPAALEMAEKMEAELN